MWQRHTDQERGKGCSILRHFLHAVIWKRSGEHEEELEEEDEEEEEEEEEDDDDDDEDEEDDEDGDK